MPQTCRLCLNTITRSSSDLSDYREGLPLSVIVMIILPIRINEDESLPQKVCSSCLNILIQAFNLREISLESDRKLRETPAKIHTVNIKSELVEDDSSIFDTFEETQEDIPSLSSVSVNQTFASSFDIKPILEIDEIYSDDLHVDCWKKVRVKNASKAWNFFGRLLNGNGDAVGSDDYFYCSPCIKKKKITKYRTTTATSSLWNHLGTIHGINKSGELVEMLLNENFKQPKKRKLEGGAATICSECGKNFSCSTILKRHMRIHGEKAFACNRCPSRFAFKENLQRHERTHDQNHFNRYCCDYCGTGFAELKSLKSHMMRVHLNIKIEKNFACPYDMCAMRFEKKFNLKKHMLTHSDYKPHSCNYCDVSYASKGDLYKHLQKLHVGDALWTCEYCQESFRLKVLLQKHYSIHYETNQSHEN